MARKRMKWFDWLLIALPIIGAINWGLVGALNWNLVEALLSSIPYAVKTVYIAVGVTGIIGLIRLILVNK